jgi:N-acetylneuraminic acid mutarotase
MKKQTNLTFKTHVLRRALYLFLLLAVCVIPFALAQSRGSGSKRSTAPQGTCPTPWQFVADMPLDLFGAAGASDGTFFYSAGGYSFSTSTTLAVFNRYDPVANTWTPLPEMPQAAIMTSAVYYPPTNKIYVFGGQDSADGTNYDITRIYDIASNSWTTGAPMPDVHSFAASGYSPATGKVYILSGYNTGFVDSAQPNTWEYDPATDTWTDLTATAPFPHPAGGFAFGVINGKLYVAGGRDAADILINLIWEYDPVANTYTSKANMPPVSPNAPGSAVALDALFVFGGGNPFIAAARSTTQKGAAHSNEDGFVRRAFNPAALKGEPRLPGTASYAYVYDPATDTWRNYTHMNERRSFPAGGFIANSNKVIVSGGFDITELITYASAEVTDACVPPLPPPCLEGLTPWSFVASYPAGALESPAIASDGTFLYSAGGFLVPVGGTTDLHYRYDPVTDTWTPKASLPEPRALTPGVFAPNVNKFYVFGGADGSLFIRDTTYIYDPIADNWSTGTPMPEKRYRANIAYNNGKIYVIGGLDAVTFTEQAQTWEYDPVADAWNTSLASIPEPMAGSGTAVEGQYIHLMGSLGNDSGTTLHYRYDVVADTWDTRAALPANNYHPAAATLSGKIYLIGGGDPFASGIGPRAALNGLAPRDGRRPLAAYTEVRVYDPVTDSWTNSQALNIQRSYPDAAAVGNSLIVVGGGDGGIGTDTDTVEKANACGGGTPTPSPTATVTPTATPTPTNTPRVTPRPRPTPHPRPTPR